MTYQPTKWDKIGDWFVNGAYLIGVITVLVVTIGTFIWAANK